RRRPAWFPPLGTRRRRTLGSLPGAKWRGGPNQGRRPTMETHSAQRRSSGCSVWLARASLSAPPEQFVDAVEHALTAQPDLPHEQRPRRGTPIVSFSPLTPRTATPSTNFDSSSTPSPSP